jgi:uncharacterized protein
MVSGAPGRLVLSPKAFASPVFAPGMFLLGILFGCPAGWLEEIGWMGFAFPRMSRAWSPLFASIVLGLLWSLWHLPVIDYLGTATPHGAYKLHYFLAFTCAMTAMRVVIAWLYSNTGRVFVNQLLHASSTSALVIFSPRALLRAKKHCGISRMALYCGWWLQSWVSVGDAIWFDAGAE